MKRAFDVSASAVLLLFGWPILLIVIIAIRLQSQGPAIFRQVRVGKNGRPFTCYKLRTMYSGTANLPTHEVQASSVTPIGEHLRRFKVDELPQLCNVLIGDMSLVGPRPCLPSQTALVEARRLLGVFEVRPGITGLAQVNGCRGETARIEEMQARVNYDLEYLRHWSPILDFKILFLTVFRL